MRSLNVLRKSFCSKRDLKTECTFSTTRSFLWLSISRHTRSLWHLLRFMIFLLLILVSIQLFNRANESFYHAVAGFSRRLEHHRYLVFLSELVYFHDIDLLFFFKVGFCTHKKDDCIFRFLFILEFLQPKFRSLKRLLTCEVICEEHCINPTVKHSC